MFFEWKQLSLRTSIFEKYVLQKLFDAVDGKKTYTTWDLQNLVNHGG